MSVHTYCQDTSLENIISNFSLVNFISEHAVKLNDSDREEYKYYMLEWHKCIKFFGIKYFLIHSTSFNKREKYIFNFLVNKYELDRKTILG